MTRTEGESITLFHASEAPWVHSLGGELKRPGTAGNFVTDGPFLRRAMNGDLLIIWSSFRKGGNYAIGLARARSGEVIGPWTQDTEPLFGDNGGHAMIFSQGSDLLLALHQPNGDSLERLKLFHLLETVEGFRLGHPYRPDSDSIKSKMEVC